MGLCTNLEGWDGKGGEREVQEGAGIGILMSDLCYVWQKPTQYCNYPSTKK